MTQSVSWVNRIYANFSIIQLISLTAILAVVFMGGTAILAASKSKSLMQQEIIEGLKAHTEGIALLLSEQALNDTEKTRELLNSIRWNNDKSGYGFVMDRNGILVAYPPNAERQGHRAKAKGLATLVEKVSRSGQPDALYYEFQKPGESAVSEKVTMLYPIDGSEWVVAVGAFLDRANSSFNSALSSSLINIGIVLALVALNTFFFSKYMSGRISGLIKALELIASKDLNFKVENYGRDEISKLNNYMMEIRIVLNELCKQQARSSGNMAEASHHLDDNISEAAASINAELQRLEMLASAMTEMAATVNEVAESAVSASEATKASDQKAHKGAVKIEDTVKAIEELNTMLNNGSKSVAHVDHNVQGISGVVDTINDISEQTNLLALNAAIEAARAGEQGRGFAVVADEVRQLASRTQSSTREIQDTIEQLKNSANKAVELIQESVVKANEGMEFAREAGSEFYAIVDDITLLADRSDQIATAAEEQTIVASEMSQNIEEIRESVTQTEKMVVDVNKASTDLKGEARQLDELLSQFSLSEAR